MPMGLFVVAVGVCGFVMTYIYSLLGKVGVVTLRWICTGMICLFYSVYG